MDGGGIASPAMRKKTWLCLLHKKCVRLCTKKRNRWIQRWLVDLYACRWEMWKRWFNDLGSAKLLRHLKLVQFLELIRDGRNSHLSVHWSLYKWVFLKMIPPNLLVLFLFFLAIHTSEKKDSPIIINENMLHVWLGQLLDFIGEIPMMVYPYDIHQTLAWNEGLWFSARRHFLSRHL